MPRFKIIAIVELTSPNSDIPNLIADELDEVIIKEIGIKNYTTTNLISIEPVVEEIPE